jgi:hypothetical protein
MYLFRRFILVLIGLNLWLCEGNALTLPELTGPAVLTVTGLDPAKFPNGRLTLDLQMLQAFAPVTFRTGSIWTSGVHAYTGLALKSLMDYLGTENARLRLHALNDYEIEIPAVETADDAPILAYFSDGMPLSVRDKGPIWVLYPFDKGPEYRTDITFARSIWQLDRIDVLQ